MPQRLGLAALPSRAPVGYAPCKRSANVFGGRCKRLANARHPHSTAGPRTRTRQTQRLRGLAAPCEGLRWGF